MLLNINFILTTPACFYILFNNEEKYIDNSKTSVSFEFFEKKEYCIEITQKETNKKIPFLNLFLYLLISPFQSMFFLLFQYGNHKWYHDVFPYFIKTKIKIKINDDLNLTVEYKNINLKHIEKKKPILNFNIDCENKLVYSKDINNYKLIYFHYARQLITVNLIVLLLFSFFSYLLLQKGENVKAIIIFVFPCLLLIYCIKYLYKERKRLNILIQKDFL